jgi:Thioesterase-like superfamily
MTWPDKITVYHKLIHDPSSSSFAYESAFEQELLILSEAHQRPAARCLEENVIYDYRLQCKTSLMPGFIIEQFKKTWAMQEEAKGIWKKRILEIEYKVRALEVASWDREDAVEDMGSATTRR